MTPRAYTRWNDLCHLKHAPRSVKTGSRGFFAAARFSDAVGCDHAPPKGGDDRTDCPKGDFDDMQRIVLRLAAERCDRPAARA